MCATPASGSNAPNWAEIATACIAFVALGGAFLQLSGARAATRRRTAFGYFERWNDLRAIPYIAEMARLLRPTRHWETDERRWQEWKKRTHERRLESMMFVNFWEELGGLYNRQLVDREVIRQYLGALSVDYWDRAHWFVECARKEERARKEEERAGKEERTGKEKGGYETHMFEQWAKMSTDIQLWLDMRDHPNLRRRARSWTFRRLFGWL